jgi:hypothetical protein
VIKELFAGVYEAGCRGEAYTDVFTAAPAKSSLIAAKAPHSAQALDLFNVVAELRTTLERALLTHY